MCTSWLGLALGLVLAFRHQALSIAVISIAEKVFKLRYASSSFCSACVRVHLRISVGVSVQVSVGVSIEFSVGDSVEVSVGGSVKVSIGVSVRPLSGHRRYARLSGALI